MTLESLLHLFSRQLINFEIWVTFNCAGNCTVMIAERMAPFDTKMSKRLS